MRLMFKRLARSQWNSKFLAFIFFNLVCFAAISSIVMYEHVRNADRVYSDFYGTTNLHDMAATAMMGYTFDENDLLQACEGTLTKYRDSDLEVENCETHYFHEEVFVVENEAGKESIPMAVHGYVPDARVTLPYIREGWGEMAVRPDEVLIDVHMHDELGIEIGESVTVMLNNSEHNLTVTGYANHARHLWYVPGPEQLMPTEGNFAVIYLPIDTLTDALGKERGERNILYLDVTGTPDYDLQDTMEDEGERLDDLRSELTNQLRDRDIQGVQISDRSGIWSVELLRQDIEGTRKTAPMFLWLLAGISAIVISISLERTVRRQSREIAVLRTIGADSKSLLMSYLSIPLGHGIVGGLVSIPFGMWGSTLMTTWYFETMIGVPVVELRHYTDIHLMVFASVIAILLIFGLWPAWRATRLSPLEVMRIEAGAKPNIFISWLTQSLPPSAGLGVRGTFRRPNRLAITIVGLGLSMILAGGMWMITSGMYDWIQDSQDAETWDVSVYMSPLDNQHVRDWVDENDHLYEAEYALLVPSNATDDRREIFLHGVEKFSTDGTSSMHKTTLIEGRLPNAGATVPEAVIDQGVARFLGWEVGDEIELVVGITNFRFNVTGVVSEIDRSVWAHHSDLTRGTGFIGETLHTTVYLRNIGDADAANDTSLENLTGTTQIVHTELEAAFDEAWENNSALFYVFLLMGAALAIAVLLNTLAINLTEHDNEFATLRILGASGARIGTILLFENMVIGLLGGVIGAWASIATAQWMGAAFTTWSWYFDFPIDWRIVFLVTGMILVSALSVTPIGTHRVKNMNLVKKAQEFSH